MVGREKYNILKKLDAGGMAEIFLAEAESIEGFKKRVAIKRVLPELVQQRNLLAMFLDEARLSLRFNHANIAHTFDVGHSNDTYFIVMEYVEGTNLKRIMDLNRKRKSRLPVALTLYIMTEVCRGLAYAHDFRDNEGKLLNVVHRDVSPPNVLLSRQGEVKIVDFGLAKATSQLEITESGMVKGKFAYLSPEVAFGNPADLRSDIFACGIILFELLTGERLFLGENDIKTVELVRNARIPSIQERNPAVKQELEQIVLKALARSPMDRYSSCNQLADAMTGYLFDYGLKVTPTDVQRLVESYEKERVGAEPKPALSKIDELIQQEIRRFSSLDERAPSLQGGTIPAQGRDLRREGSAPLDPKGFKRTPPPRDDGIWQAGIGKGSHVYVPAKSLAPPPSQSQSPPLVQMLEGEFRDEAPSVHPQSSTANSVLTAVAVALFGLGAGAIILYWLGIIP